MKWQKETGKSVVLEAPETQSFALKSQILRSLTDAVQQNPKIRVHTSSPVTRHTVFQALHSFLLFSTSLFLKILKESFNIFNIFKVF